MLSDGPCSSPSVSDPLLAGLLFRPSLLQIKQCYTPSGPDTESGPSSSVASPGAPNSPAPLDGQRYDYKPGEQQVRHNTHHHNHHHHRHNHHHHWHHSHHQKQQQGLHVGMMLL